MSPSRAATPALPMMITPVGQRSTQRPQRVQTSSSTTKTTWSSGSRPGCSVPTASATVSAPSMWMHFHGQMSTQPSHMMHSDWSMWRNCFGFTDLLRSSGAISCRTYSPGNAGIGGLASVLATSDPPHQRTAEVGGRHLGALDLSALLPHRPERDLPSEHHDVDARRDHVA